MASTQSKTGTIFWDTHNLYSILWHNLHIPLTHSKVTMFATQFLEFVLSMSRIIPSHCPIFFILFQTEYAVVSLMGGCYVFLVLDTFFLPRLGSTFIQDRTNKNTNQCQILKRIICCI